jgi:ribosomal protein S18 acetylase RimI-like enzyme
MIRPGGRHDVRFLRDMLKHAYYWRERMPRGPIDAPVQRYVMNWGRPGDASVIAIDEGNPVGAAWYRLFKEEERGYGFVDERTPELTIAVVPSRRGKGLGDELLSALLERARKDGFTQISLSVEPENPALRLYERHGFHKVGEYGGSSTMLADLQPSGSAAAAR